MFIMTLAEYLQTKNLKHAEFARIIRTSRQNVNRWATGQGRPRPADMHRISEATGGAVTANDFFGMNSKEAA